MKKYFLDTNVILRYLLQDNPVQCDEADEAFQEAKNREVELVLCQAIIFEAFYVLVKYYEIEKKIVIEMLGKIINIPYLSVENRSEFSEAILRFSQANVSLIDCFLVAKAESVGAHVLSFDKDIKKLKKSQ